MALPNPSPGDSVAADDIDQIRNHLEGGSGKTAPYHLRQSTGNFLVTLPDAAGATQFRINDSGGVDIFHVDSDGNVTVTGTLTQSGGLILPISASPSQTAEGSVVWNSATDELTIGDGSSRKVFSAGNGLDLVGSNTVDTTTTSTSWVDLITVTLTRSVLVSEGLLIIFNYSKDALAAAQAGFGVKLNTTAITGGGGASNGALTSATNQAEDGTAVLWITPRSTGYLNGFMGHYQSRVSATGASEVLATALTPASNNSPNASITQVVITAFNSVSNVNASVKEVQVYAF